MSLQNKLQQIGTALSGVTTNCYHYWRFKKDYPCIVWAETAEEYSFNSDNHKTIQRIIGTVDLFTHTEFDTLIDTVQTTLDSLQMTWGLESVQYEEETNLIHYQWNWGVTFDGPEEVVPSGNNEIQGP